MLTVANIDTGRYRVSGTVPTGYAQGDRFAISVSAAIGGVATKSVIQCCDVRVAPLTDGAGVVTANITQLLASVLTESAPGSLAAAFKKLLDVSSPTFTVASALQSGDSFARIGNAGSALTAIGDTRLALLDAAVSSRSTYAGADTPGTTTLLSRIGTPANGTVSADIALVEGHAAAADSTATSLLGLLQIVSGLVGMNCGIRNTAYSAGQLTSADICLYDGATHAALNDGSTGLLHRFTLSGTVSGGNLSTQTSSLSA